MNLNNKEKFAIIFIGFLVLFSLGLRLFRFLNNKQEEVVQPIAGNVVTSSTTPIDSSSTTTKEIIVDQPLSGESFESPYVVTGKARGNWFFESSFPLNVVNEQDQVIGSGLANAQMDWMTSDLVPFVGFIQFLSDKIPATGTKVFLVLSKDNPSGLPEHDASLKMPIIIK